MYSKELIKYLALEKGFCAPEEFLARIKMLLTVHVCGVAAVVLVTAYALYLHSKQALHHYCFKVFLYSLFISILCEKACMLISDGLHLAGHTKDGQSPYFFVYYVFLYLSFVFSKIFNLQTLLIALERCRAVVRPLSFKSSRLKHRAVMLMTLTQWLLYTVIYTPNLVVKSLRHNYSMDTMQICSAYFDVLVPIMVAVCYCVISVKMWRRGGDIRQLVRRQATGYSARASLYCMVVGPLFVLTSLPVYVDILFFKGRYFYRGVLFCRLVNQAIDPIAYIMKIGLERKCCRCDRKMIIRKFSEVCVTRKLEPRESTAV